MWIARQSVAGVAKVPNEMPGSGATRVAGASVVPVVIPGYRPGDD